MKQKGLGRGLDAIFGSEHLDARLKPMTEMAEISVSAIFPNPTQPRTEFDEEALEELADSIRTLGVIQPITVKRTDDGRYLIISGERRWRAARKAGLESLPAYIREVDDENLHAMALVENIQREDLNAIEIALGMQRLIDECNLTQEALSEKVGKKRSTVSNYMRLLKLPNEVQLALKEGLISMGHAKAIAGAPEELQLRLLKKCIRKGLSVRQIEELVRLGELTKRAWEKDVQVMVEGPGHVPMDQIAANMKVQQSICMGAPFYVLGPLVTDIAPGYDHITAAIGGAVAAMNGAAFLCYVTPAEHLALPNVEDTKQGIIASKIAAHAADIAKGIPGARDIDDRMADARQKLDWEAQYACALDPETAKAIRDSRSPEDDHSDTCSMCGKFCAVRSMNKALAGEYIDIL